MALITDFDGFPREITQFYSDLAENNNKRWFDEHKTDFSNYVMAPAAAFVFELGKKLSELSPRVNADPRVNKSIFRPHRDTRFSRDKTPYKTHLGIFFWEGKLPKMECSGFYFHLEPPNLVLGAGIHCFSPRLTDAYRIAASHPASGPALAESVATLTAKPGYNIGGKHYKRLPRGYQAVGMTADLLLHNGLFASSEGRIPDELYSADILDYCISRFREMVPVHKWLVAMTENV